MKNDSILSLVILAVLFFVLPSLFKLLGKYTLGTRPPGETDDEEVEGLQPPGEADVGTWSENRDGNVRRRHRGFRKPPAAASPDTGEAGAAQGYTVIEPGRNEPGGHKGIANRPITPRWF